MSAASVLSTAVSLVARGLKPRGFERHRLKLLRAGNEVLSLIEFQPGRDRTREMLTYVVNYGVVVPPIFRGMDPDDPAHTECHWSGRVLSAVDGREAWFPVRATDDPAVVAGKLTELVEHDVLPALEGKQHEADLIAVWLTGKGPGLSAAARLLFLAQLLHRAGRRGEVAAVRAALERREDTPFVRRALETVKTLEAQK